MSIGTEMEIEKDEVSEEAQDRQQGSSRSQHKRCERRPEVLQTKRSEECRLWKKISNRQPKKN